MYNRDKRERHENTKKRARLPPTTAIRELSFLYAFTNAFI